MRGVYGEWVKGSRRGKRKDGSGRGRRKGFEKKGKRAEEG